MKATGIVRRIDDLGRVVVPKEIRRTLRIREGDPLEIFTDREGEIILKKYSPIGELGAFAQQYADAMAQVLGVIVLISDKDQFIAAAGGGLSGFSKNNWLLKPISSELEDLISERTPIFGLKDSRGYISISPDIEAEDATWQAVAPIISEGDAIGSVVLLGRDNGKMSAKAGDAELKHAATAAVFLGKQMEG